MSSSDELKAALKESDPNQWEVAEGYWSKWVLLRDMTDGNFGGLYLLSGEGGIRLAMVTGSRLTALDIGEEFAEDALEVLTEAVFTLMDVKERKEAEENE